MIEYDKKNPIKMLVDVGALLIGMIGLMLIIYPPRKEK